MPLKPDDTVCFCFHVPLRKIESFCRIEQPRVASQISECLSAGTGCGWCVPMLRKIHARMCPAGVPWWKTEAGTSPASAGTSEAGEPEVLRDADTVEQDDYAKGRSTYIAAGRGKPPK